MFGRRKPASNWQLVWEIPTHNQDRAAQFAKDVYLAGKPELMEKAAQDAAKLFGRAFLVDMNTGARNPVRQYEYFSDPREVPRTEVRE